jgi:hypothetical protein
MSINPQETYVLNSESTAKLLAKLDGDDRQKKEKKKSKGKRSKRIVSSFVQEFVTMVYVERL